MFKSIRKIFNKKNEKIAEGYGVTPEETDTADPEKGNLPKTWIGVDLDGTLAYLDRNSSYSKVGEPIPAMMDLVRKMINSGIRIKIFTARAEDPEQIPIIRKWLKANNLPELEITNVKDFKMQRLYDDRCIQVERNTGRLIIDGK